VKHISVLAVAVLAGCSNAGSQPSFVPAGAAQQSAVPTASHTGEAGSAGYVYVANRTMQGTSELVVYRPHPTNPVPLKTITSDVVDIGGIAVDSSGFVYVANGRAGNVLEFSPGGASIVRTFSKGLSNPVDVAVANGTLYVADRGSAANGYAQQIFEYGTTTASDAPTSQIAGLGGPSQFNGAVAVDPLASSTTFFASASSVAAMPPGGACNGSTYALAQNIFPTLWVNVRLSHNSQVSGVAFDSQGNLYASDACANRVDVYAYKNYRWSYARQVRASFRAPLFLTISNGYLAVPSASSAIPRVPGYVTLIDLNGDHAAFKISTGLSHPIGVAIDPPA
jgi:hypothetical protein